MSSDAWRHAPIACELRMRPEATEASAAIALRTARLFAAEEPDRAVWDEVVYTVGDGWSYVVWWTHDRTLVVAQVPA